MEIEAEVTDRKTGLLDIYPEYQSISNTTVNVPIDSYSKPELIELPLKSTNRKIEEEDRFQEMTSRPTLQKFLELRKKYWRTICWCLFLIGFFIYFAFAMSPRFGHPPFPYPSGNYILFILTVLTIGFYCFRKSVQYVNRKFKITTQLKQHTSENNPKTFRIVKIVFHVTMLSTIIAVIATTVESKYSITVVQAFFGCIIWIICASLISNQIRVVNWHHILNAIYVQFVFGLLVMRTQVGVDVMEFFSSTFVRFFNFSIAGAEFVFGDLLKYGTFVLIIVPVIVYIAAVVYLLFHLGWIQLIVGELSTIYTFLLAVSAAESASAIANIFLAFTESIFIFEPFLLEITDNEICTMAIIGLASVSGSTIPLYIDFGAQAVHIFTSCIMTSACALMFAKITYPPVKSEPKSALTKQRIKEHRLKKYKNALDATLAGSKTGVSVAGAVIGSMLAVISLLKLADSLVEWLFDMVRVHGMDFQRLMSYFFWPIAFFMGIDKRDCMAAGQLLGIKTIVNELVAFEKFGEMISYRDNSIRNGSFSRLYCGESIADGAKPILTQEKSIIIMTYALCGFGNIGTIGLQIACISVLNPHRTGLMSSNSLKFLAAALLSNSFSAGLAGLIYDTKRNNHTLLCA